MYIHKVKKNADRNSDFVDLYVNPKIRPTIKNRMAIFDSCPILFKPKAHGIIANNKLEIKAAFSLTIFLLRNIKPKQTKPLPEQKQI